MERITSAQPPPCVPKHAALDIADMTGNFPIYVYKARRGMKRDESKETYKLPHRLIEKKRRDRINECIAQLKDLLPEHLKLTTLGHLEKAVVLELTLKHVKALSALLEQQQQKIISLQKDLQIGDNGDGVENGEEMFRCGFHLCAKEVLHYLSSQESSRDLTPSNVITHIHKVAAEVLQQRSSPHPEESIPHATEKPQKHTGQPQRASEGPAKNCVPVIQRTYPHGAGEQSGSDTDTDSGYGGEHDKREAKAQWSEIHAKEGEHKRSVSEHSSSAIKREGDEPQAKRARSDSTEEEILAAHGPGGPGSYMSFSPNQPPFCLPFYLIPPQAATAAAYLPMLEKCWYPGGMPVMYPGLSGSAVSLPPETLHSSLVMSPRAGSPVPHHIAMDSPALHKALKHAPPLNLETKD
ncbi:class E basic helix-loop-helix protein 40 [Echeneis naucrates]|uniref:Class E basic helix-loop-helix protein 40-like n=1 Tax=Echeneis naucrates TaxID=173247 RepID=A0A665W3D9_ECHNA|nr:class E basic helix-loop-helix protein 40-like [Echeneis naucrates]